MGAITGDLCREEIQKMLDRYKDVGITQFLIYPRDGCEVEYMSERWLQICEDIVEYADTIGMDIWLYDEFNWPSGTALGEVMKADSIFKARHVEITDSGYEIKSSKLAVGRIPEEYSDILNPDAVDTFINLTHEKYYKRLGKYFGKTIKGIFTDEPSILYCTYGGGFPYFKDAEKFYIEKTGRDLFSDMKTASNEFYRDYYSLLGEKFANIYVKRLSNWCKDHNILLTGHLLSDDSLDGWVKSSGNALKVISEFDLPGIDEILTASMENYQLCSYIQYAAQRLENGCLAELFALGPTDIPPSRIEQQIWVMAMFGVTHYVLAVSAADARGNVRKNGWYNPMNYTSPWFEGYPQLGISAAKAADFAKKRPAIDVYVKVPIDEYAKLSGTGEKQKELRDEFQTLFTLLAKEQYEWLLILDEKEATKNLPILDITKKCANALVSELKNSTPRERKVLTQNGELPEHILFRRFEDNEEVIIDLSDSSKPRDLILRTKDKDIPFTLEGRGHIVTSEGLPVNYQVISELHPEFSITLDRPNTLRANIKSDLNKFEFTAAARIDNIRLLVRNYKSGGDISIDGIFLKADKKCNALTDGFSDLYSSTEEFSLSPGKHTIAITTPAKSEPYLPSCFICGYFAADNSDTLKALPKKVDVGLIDDILPQYAGKITFETMIDIPTCECKLQVGCADLYTKVILNGIPHSRISGYVYDVPAELRGKNVLLRIEQYTTLGPIFGRADDVISEENLKEYGPIKRFFPGKYEKCGIEYLRFVR